MRVNKIRYIVLMLTPDTQQYLLNGDRIDTHDGDIFCNLKDAREYAMDAIASKLCTRFVCLSWTIKLKGWVSALLKPMDLGMIKKMLLNSHYLNSKN